MTPTRDRFWFRLVLIALLALTVRVGYIGVAKWSDEVEFSDALYYAVQAQQIAEGEAFEHREHDRPAADHAPLTEISQAPTAVLFGRSVLALRLVQAVYGTLGVVAIALLARRVADSDRVALWAALVAAVYPNLWAADGVIMAETLTVLLVAVLLWAVYGFLDHPDGRRALLVGALAGLAALAGRAGAGRGAGLRAGGRAGGPALVPAARLSGPRRPGGGGRPGAVDGLQRGRFDEPVLVSTNDGLTLIGANCDRQYDGPDPGLWDIACLPPGSFTDAQSQDQSAVNLDYRRLAIDYAWANQGDLPRVAAIRVARTWSLYDPASMIRYNQNEGREPPVGWAGFVAFWLLVPFAVGGAVLLRSRGRALWPLLSTIVVVTLVSALFYGLLRFRAPAEVTLVVLAAVAMAELQARFGPGPRAPPESLT